MTRTIIGSIVYGQFAVLRILRHLMASDPIAAQWSQVNPSTLRK